MSAADVNLRSASPKRGLPALVKHHHDLEVACADFLQELAADPHTLASHWHALDAALRDHMATEEELLFPDYQLVAPEDGDALRTDHARIRELLHDVGRDVQQHQLHEGRLRQLVALLHAHAARENASLYVWAESAQRL